MEYIVEEIRFDIGLSKAERAAIRRMISGRKEKFEILSEAQIRVKVRMEVEKKGK